MRVVVLAHDPLVLRLGVDGDLRDEPCKEEFEIVLGQRVRDDVLARVEEGVEALALSGDPLRVWEDLEELGVGLGRA